MSVASGAAGKHQTDRDWLAGAVFLVPGGDAPDVALRASYAALRSGGGAGDRRIGGILPEAESMSAKGTTKKKKSRRGKQHPAHAASFANIAKDLKQLPGYYGAAAVFEKEANRLRGIVR